MPKYLWILIRFHCNAKRRAFSVPHKISTSSAHNPHKHILKHNSFHEIHRPTFVICPAVHKANLPLVVSISVTELPQSSPDELLTTRARVSEPSTASDPLTDFGDLLVSVSTASSTTPSPHSVHVIRQETNYATHYRYEEQELLGQHCVLVFSI